MEFFLGGGKTYIVRQGEESGKDANDIAIEHSERNAECERCDGGGGIRAEAGKCGQLSGIRGKASLVVTHEELCRLLDLAGTGIVAETFPEFEDVLQRRSGEGGGIGETRKKAKKVGDDGVDARLLEHDFGNPDGVGRAGFCAPWQVAGVLREPWQQTFSDGGTERWDVRG